MNKVTRKNRTGPPRPQQRGRSAVIEGVYNNVHFMHAIASQIGNVVQIQTKSGAIFEGIFYTVSPHFEIVLQLVHRIEVPGYSVNSTLLTSQTSNNTSSGNNDSPAPPLDDQSVTVGKVFEVLIFKPCDVVFLKAKDVDLEYATKDTFQTDAAISKCNGSRFDEKELEPWHDGDNSSVNGDVDMSFELDNNANGWDVNDMFSLNEQRYGVQSTFDNSLSGYTIQIQEKDTQDYRDAEKQAEKIALEIESQPAYKERTDVENGDENEEAKFAAVERPRSSSPDEIKAGKYVAPGRRKQHNTQAGKLIRPTQLINSNISGNPSTSSVQVVAPHQNSNNKYSAMVPHSLPLQQSVQKTSASSPPVQQQALMHRMHNQQPLQQIPISHKQNGEEQSGNSHHRRNRTDMEGDRGDRRERLDRERNDRMERDVRDIRDPRENRDRDRDRDSLRDTVKTIPSMPQRNNQMLVSSTMNQISTSPHQGPPQHQNSSPQIRIYHNQPLLSQESQPNVPAHLILQPQQIVSSVQSQRVQRDGQIADFRKFKQNFVLSSPKGQRTNEQSQQLQHQNPATTSEARPNPEENVNQSKQFSKPYTIQMKQYPANENLSNSIPPATLSSENDKRNSQQQVTKSGSNSASLNQTPDNIVEQSTQSYVSVVQQTANQSQPQQKPSGENERSTPSIVESQQDYPPAAVSSSQPQTLNNSNTPSSTPPASTNLQTPVSSNDTTLEKQQNAPKKFTLNPAAKPFTPRNPVTPTSSRPHTPQTPGTQQNNAVLAQPVHSNIVPTGTQQSQLPLHPPQQPTPQPPMPGQHVGQGSVIPMAYFVQQQAFSAPPHAQQAIAYSNASMGMRKPAYDRKNQLPVSQVQVAAAASAVTGAPLHVATPMAQYLSHYPQAHPQTFQAPYAHMQFHQGHQPAGTTQYAQPLQYLAATPPSTTPSPGQPHQQQFHQGPQPTGTTQYAQATPQQFQVIPVMNGPPVVAAAPYMQAPNSGPFLLVQPHPQQ